MRTVVPAGLPIPWINMGPADAGISIPNAIAEYSRISGGRVVYIGSMALRNNAGHWTDDPFAVFWQEKPKPEHSHYFGLVAFYDKAHITNAISVIDHDWLGAMHPKTGEIIFSRYRHDYRVTADKSIMRDGGPGLYTRGYGDAIPVVLRVIRDRMRVVQIGARPRDGDLASHHAT